jgi:hypothetical protein
MDIKVIRQVRPSAIARVIDGSRRPILQNPSCCESRPPLPDSRHPSWLSRAGRYFPYLRKRTALIVNGSRAADLTRNLTTRPAFPGRAGNRPSKHPGEIESG